MHADRQHIDVGRHAGCPHRFGPLQVGLGRMERLLGSLELCRRQHRAIVSLHRTGDHLHPGPALLLARHLPREFGRFHRVGGLPGVIKHLVQRQLGLEVVQRPRPVQRTQVEIFRPELMLRQQRAEYKDRVVAAREGFRIVQLGEPSGASLVDASRGRAQPGAGSGYGLVLPEGQLHRLAQRQRILRPNSSGEDEQQWLFHDFWISYFLHF